MTFLHVDSRAYWSEMCQAEPVGRGDVDIGGTMVHSILELQSSHGAQQCFVTPKIRLASNSFFLLYSPIFFVFFRVYTVVSGLIRSAVCQSLFYSILCFCRWVFYVSLLLPPYPGKETVYDFFFFYMARAREQTLRAGRGLRAVSDGSR